MALIPDGGEVMGTLGGYIDTGVVTYSQRKYDLDNEAIPPISVTKTYTDIVLSHFTEQSPLLEPMQE